MAEKLDPAILDDAAPPLAPLHVPRQVLERVRPGPSAQPIVAKPERP